MMGRLPVFRALAEHETGSLLRVFRDVDVALEWCEDQILANMLKHAEICAVRARCVQGLSAEEYRLVQTIVRPPL